MRHELEEHAGWLAEVDRAAVVSVDHRRDAAAHPDHPLAPGGERSLTGPGDVVDGAGAEGRALWRRFVEGEGGRPALAQHLIRLPTSDPEAQPAGEDVRAGDAGAAECAQRDERADRVLGRD